MVLDGFSRDTDGFFDGFMGVAMVFYPVSGGVFGVFSLASGAISVGNFALIF
jgi:hypothetical protein